MKKSNQNTSLIRLYIFHLHLTLLAKTQTLSDFLAEKQHVHIIRDWNWKKQEKQEGAVRKDGVFFHNMQSEPLQLHSRFLLSVIATFY